MKRIVLLILLTACAPVQDSHSGEGTSSNASSIIEAFDSIEQVPASLTLDHFAKMKLVGAGLKLLEQLARTESYTRYRIEYLSNGLRISGILNVPRGTGPFPLIILNHGYIDPKVYTVGRGLKREQDYLARHGFAVLHTDYRGHGLSDDSPDTREIYDAGLEYAMDSINAINAIRESDLSEISAINTKHVGMLGHSLGGGVTLNILTAHPEMIDAAVLYAPVSGDAYKNFNRWRRERPEGDKTIAVWGEKEENTEPWNAISALTHLRTIDDPVLIFHGSEDTDVPLDWSIELGTALQEELKDSTFVVYDGEKHEFVSQWNDFMEKTVAFFTEQLTAESE